MYLYIIIIIINGVKLTLDIAFTTQTISHAEKIFEHAEKKRGRQRIENGARTGIN